ncbi:MAG TPA: FkbM family methyltransferase [Planctomycetota bacterium]|nr:FkbM family methyltransferase [Planctomycetota bacterium]
MLRALKGVLKGIVPSTAKQWLKQKLYPSAASATPFSLRESGDKVDVLLENKVLLKAPWQLRGDVAAIFEDRQCCLEPFGILEQARKGNGVLLDVGAHVGLMSVLFASAAKDNRAIAFEPSPALQTRAKEIAAMNGVTEQVAIEPIAVGAALDKTTMLIDPVGGYVQVKRYEHSMQTEPKQIDVQVDTLDNVSSRLGIRGTVIKLDIEGYEYEALKGAQRVLSQHHPIIFLELHLDYLEARGIAPAAVLEILQQHRYSFCSLRGEKLAARQIVGSHWNRFHLVAIPDA